MSTHKHVLISLPPLGSKACSCGVEICSVQNSDKTIGCNLEKGHSGPHSNTWKPEAGTWTSKRVSSLGPSQE